MKTNRVVKTGVVSTIVRGKAYSDETGITDFTVELFTTTKTTNGLEKAVREELEHDGLSLVKIMQTEKHTTHYAVPFEQFMTLATKVDE